MTVYNAPNGTKEGQMGAYITVEQAAAIMRVDESYVRRLARQNKIKARRFGGVWQVSKAAAEKWPLEKSQRRE